MNGSNGTRDEVTAARILVADDDANIAGLVQMYLRKAGFDVSLAADGDETLAMLRDHEYDLLVLDIMMPGKDGLQIIRGLRRRSEMPVIFLSARASDQRSLTLRMPIT